MPRAEVELTEEEAHRLDEVASSKGQSVAEVLQESVREYLGKTIPNTDPSLAVGSFKELLSKMPDTGDDHDFDRNDDLGRGIDL